MYPHHHHHRRWRDRATIFLLQNPEIGAPIQAAGRVVNVELYNIPLAFRSKYLGLPGIYRD